MKIKQARLSDYKELANLHYRVWQTTYKEIIPSDKLTLLSISEYEENWNKWLNQNDATTLLATQQGELLGFVGYAPAKENDLQSRNYAEIFALYITPENWRKGIGRKLCNAACEALKEQQYHGIISWVLATNIQARMFYQELNFQVDGHEKNYDSHPNIIDDQIEIRYELNL